MFSEAAIAEFADKYSDHIVFASATGAGGLLATVWRVLPVEIVVMIFAAAFISARICIERLIHRHRRHKAKRRNLGQPPAKRRVSV